MPPPVATFPWSPEELADRLRAAVASYWDARLRQSSRQRDAGVIDTGARGEVTGGQHMNLFIALICELIRLAGFLESEIRFKSGVELPGFYRPLKK